jgi:hypothetical protein
MSNLLKLGVATFALAGNQGLLAAEPEIVSTETRTYDILVDHKPSGQNTLTITRYSDGTETVAADAKVKVTWTVFTYVYEFQGKERWQQGQLEQLTSRAVDGGRRLSLSATRADGGFSIAKDNRKPAAGPDVQLTTNYWREPAQVPAGGALTVLDADNGKLYEVKVERIGKEELTVAGQQVPASGYRLKGKLDVELWFDSQGLLVRQVGVEDGHPTELRLRLIQRSTPAPRSKER